MHVVLVAPQIPQNSGNIGRLCAGTNTDLHLVEPLGYSLDDRYLKRAGLDYWPHVKLHVHPSLEAVLELAGDAPMAFYSSHAEAPYTDVPATMDTWHVFGREQDGLGAVVRERESARLYRIPLTTHVRSLNLANSVAVVMYDAYRRMGFPFDAGPTPV